jgi:hypothetical protein
MKNLSKYIHATIYVVAIVLLYSEYQCWLNPLDLKPEVNPKQHDGSQEFQRPIEFESSVEPMPDEDGVVRHMDAVESHNLGKEFEKELDQKID